MMETLGNRIRSFVANNIISAEPKRDYEALTAAEQPKVSAVEQEARFVKDAIGITLGIVPAKPEVRSQWRLLVSGGDSRLVFLTRDFGRYSTDPNDLHEVAHAKRIYRSIDNNLICRRRGYEDRLTRLMDEMARTEPIDVELEGRGHG